MAEDLAIDVGIPNDSDEFETFVSCVNNILDHGCGYSEEVTAQICEKCETSELPIAKKVVRECRRVRRNTGGIRPSNLKWWQTWQSKHESTVPRWPGRSPSPTPRPKNPPRVHRKKKRPMSPMFNDRRRKRPMSPMFNNRRARQPAPRGYGSRGRSPVRGKRPMSPMFKDKRSQRYRPPDRRGGRESREPKVSYERSPKKRRRYR